MPQLSKAEKREAAAQWLKERNAAARNGEDTIIDGVRIPRTDKVVYLYDYLKGQRDKLYLVTSSGRIISFTQNGVPKIIGTGKDDYITVRPSSRNNLKLHRIVWYSFARDYIDNPKAYKGKFKVRCFEPLKDLSQLKEYAQKKERKEDQYEVHHMDGNTNNNRLDNLILEDDNHDILTAKKDLDKAIEKYGLDREKAYSVLGLSVEDDGKSTIFRISGNKTSAINYTPTDKELQNLIDDFKRQGKVLVCFDDDATAKEIRSALRTIYNKRSYEREKGFIYTIDGFPFFVKLKRDKRNRNKVNIRRIKSCTDAVDVFDYSPLAKRILIKSPDDLRNIHGRISVTVLSYGKPQLINLQL